MKDLLAVVKKRVLRQAVAGIFLCGVGAAMHGKLLLLIPLLVGCAVGGVCWLISAYRLLKSADLDMERAKRSMSRGWLLRVMLISSASVIALRISSEVFGAVIVGIFFSFLLMMVNAVFYALHDHVGRKL